MTKQIIENEDGKMQKLAIIDCGTNTFHLLVVSANSKNISLDYRKQIPVKLGEGGINKKIIQPGAYQRGMDALKVFADKIKELNIDKVTAYATSAVRSAENGEKFVEEALKETGITLQTISGPQEATLIFNGVRHAFPLTDENVLVMDIGGGSVEFIIGNKEKMQWYGSFDVGAARLAEMFHRTDPISVQDVNLLNGFLEQELSPLTEALKKYPVQKLVGSAGSFDSICDLVNEKFGRNLLVERETWCPIAMNEYHQVHETLLASTLEERKNMRGLVDYRVEMMVVASCLVDYVIRTNHLTELFCSTYSLKEGVLFEALGDSYQFQA